MKSVLTALALLATAGCDMVVEHAGPTVHDTQSIALDKSEMARVEIRMGAGELQVDGGSSKLLDADFTYNIASWKPDIKYTSTGVRGELLIQQPRGVHGGGHTTYQWNLRLNNDLPLDFIAQLGAGTARMNLGGVNLRSLDVNLGVGELRLDLTGKPQRDYDVKINGGVGQATVYLPNTVGIVATAHGGIGDINVRGLEKHGDTWINPGHENARVTIHVKVNGGVGQITLIAE